MSSKLNKITFIPTVKFFSLIEALIVLSVFMMLLSLITPALQKSLTVAKQIACVNNLRVMGAAVFLYTNDHADNMPGLSYHTPWLPNQYKDLIKMPSDKKGDENVLTELEKYYLNDLQNFLCPEDTFVDPKRPHYTWKSSYGAASRHTKLSVFGSFTFTKNPEPKFYFLNRKITGFDRTNIIMFADAGRDSITGKEYRSWLAIRPGNNGIKYEGSVSDRHSFNPNYIAIDGHVESQPTDVLQLQRNSRDIYTYEYWWRDETL